MNKFNFLIHSINKNIAQSLPYKGRVIDLGCGTAAYKEDILKVAEEYVGVDWECSFHDRSNVDVFADLSRPLPFEDECADTLVSFQVMEHLKEPSFFLSECYRILKSGGGLFLTLPFMWEVHEAPYDFFRYTRYGLEYLLQKNGFVDIEIIENTGFWQMWVLKFNYHTERFACGPLKYLWIPIWWIGQVISPVLDRYDKHPQETGSYTVLTRKPWCL
jgi:SAM-dependent methyltransferase